MACEWLIESNHLSNVWGFLGFPMTHPVTPSGTYLIKLVQIRKGGHEGKHDWKLRNGKGKYQQILSHSKIK